MTAYASNRRNAYNAFVSPFPFEPRGGVSLSCSTSSASAALGDGNQALITNQGSVYAFVVFGASNVNATTNRLAIPPESQVLVTIPETAENTRATHVAGITSSSTATLQIETGFGV
jgi:hypothetical protein